MDQNKAKTPDDRKSPGIFHFFTNFQFKKHTPPDPKLRAIVKPHSPVIPVPMVKTSDSRPSTSSESLSGEGSGSLKKNHGNESREPKISKSRIQADRKESNIHVEMAHRKQERQIYLKNMKIPTVADDEPTVLEGRHRPAVLNQKKTSHLKWKKEALKEKDNEEGVKKEVIPEARDDDQKTVFEKGAKCPAISRNKRTAKLKWKVAVKSKSDLSREDPSMEAVLDQNRNRRKSKTSVMSRETTVSQETVDDDSEFNKREAKKHRIRSPRCTSVEGTTEEKDDATEAQPLVPVDPKPNDNWKHHIGIQQRTIIDFNHSNERIVGEEIQSGTSGTSGTTSESKEDTDSGNPRLKISGSRISLDTTSGSSSSSCASGNTSPQLGTFREVESPKPPKPATETKPVKEKEKELPICKTKEDKSDYERSISVTKKQEASEPATTPIAKSSHSCISADQLAIAKPKETKPFEAPPPEYTEDPLNRGELILQYLKESGGKLTTPAVADSKGAVDEEPESLSVAMRFLRMCKRNNLSDSLLLPKQNEEVRVFFGGSREKKDCTKRIFDLFDLAIEKLLDLVLFKGDDLDTPIDNEIRKFIINRQFAKDQIMVTILSFPAYLPFSWGGKMVVIKSETRSIVRSPNRQSREKISKENEKEKDTSRPSAPSDWSRMMNNIAAEKKAEKKEKKADKGKNVTEKKDPKPDASQCSRVPRASPADPSVYLRPK